VRGALTFALKPWTRPPCSTLMKPEGRRGSRPLAGRRRGAYLSALACDPGLRRLDHIQTPIARTRTSQVVSTTIIA